MWGCCRRRRGAARAAHRRLADEKAHGQRRRGREPRRAHPARAGPLGGRGRAHRLRALARGLRGLFPAQLGLALHIHHLSRRAALALCDSRAGDGALCRARAGEGAGPGLGALPLAAGARDGAHSGAWLSGGGRGDPDARVFLGRGARAGGRAKRAGHRGLSACEHRLSGARAGRAPARALLSGRGAADGAARGRDGRALRPRADGAAHLSLLRPRAEHQRVRRHGAHRGAGHGALGALGLCALRLCALGGLGLPAAGLRPRARRRLGKARPLRPARRPPPA